MPLLEALPRLASLTAAEVARAPASIEAWSLAAKLALDLVGRERIVPRVVPAKDDGSEARFAVALAAPEDSERVVELAKAFPLAAHAVPANRGRRGPKALEVWTPEALLRAFLDAAADVLVRAAIGLRTVRQKAAHIPWERRLIIALCGPDAGFEPEGFQERTLVRDLNVWTRPALGVEADAPRACFRLDFPDGDGPQADKFPLRFFLQAADDPSLLVPAEEVLLGKGQALGRLGHGFNAAEEYLLRALATAARLFPPIARGLREARPGAVLLEAAEAWTFLTEAAPAFAEAGMGVILPAELTKSGQRRLRLRMRVGGAAGGAAAGMVTGASGLSLESVRSFQWEAALAGDPLSAGDLAHLAHLKAPLVRFRGQWVAVDPTELEEVRRLVASGGGTLAAHEALAAALGGTMQRPETGMPIDVVADGDLAGVVARLRGRVPVRAPVQAGRRSRATSTARCARTRSAASAGSCRWPSWAWARASPTTWGSARPFSSSRSCCTGARSGPTTGARRSSCVRRPSSATGNARSPALPRRCRSSGTTAPTVRGPRRSWQRPRPTPS